MSGPRAVRSLSARSLGRALALLSLSVLLLGVVELGLTLAAPDGALVDVVTTVVAWVYVGAGVLAWWRRPSNQLGALIVLGGVAVMVAGFSTAPSPVVSALGTALATAPLAVLYHLLLAFPSGRLTGSGARLTVLGVYVVSLVLQAPLYLFDPGGAVPAALLVADRPDLATLGALVQSAGGLAVTVATAAILLGRLRRATPHQRRLLAPFFGYGIGAVLFVPVSTLVLAPALGWSPGTVGLAQTVVVLGVPVAFTFGVLRGGFARTGELSELGVWLGEADPHRLDLVGALARSLGDPSVDVVWEPHGTDPVEPDAVGRAWAEIELGGRRVARIAYDPGLIADADLVRTAGRVVAIAADRERLTTELQRSRVRLVDAADRERHRIAQDLHDGMQVQLVLLALHAQQIACAPGSSAAVRQEAVALRLGIDGAARDLRELVHAVMPSALVERGLAAAVEDLVDRVPIPTHLELDVAGTALPEAIEMTAYFVIAEGLANAVKHARSTAIAVRVARSGDRLEVEVCDDGVGGAHLSGSTGLRGLADRLDVLGGRLVVHSPPGRGTQVRAELPCGS